jgi:DNA polymerase-3 subunit gamma/tau
LHNYSIDIVLDVIVQEQGEKKLLYTQSDKYDFLVQKHPLLGELKQKLGLDHEF